MECYVKWMTYSSSERRRVSTMNAYVKCLEDSRKDNVTLNSKKCQFSVQEVKFLGQTINESGISPDQDKVKAIIDTPERTDVSGIRRFIGMINQLGKFTPHLAEITKPMRDLLSKKNDWTWGHSQQMCFAQLKDSLTSAPVLALYNANREQHYLHLHTA